MTSGGTVSKVFKESSVHTTVPVGEYNAAIVAKDQAYHERNELVAALARIYPSGLATTDIPGWDPKWHGCVYIDLPTGQVSWHFHDSEAFLFEGLPPYRGEWDGHTTEQKYERLARLGRHSTELSGGP